MTRVDFYLLPDADGEAKHRFCCRLAHRAVVAGKRVHVRLPEESAAALDALMWDYPQDQFLPHARLAEADGEPVTIGGESDEPERKDVLVNLSDTIPRWFPQCERVAEVTLATERAGSREKYRRYRDRGYPLFHHQLGDWE